MYIRITVAAPTPKGSVGVRILGYWWASKRNARVCVEIVRLYACFRTQNKVAPIILGLVLVNPSLYNSSFFRLVNPSLSNSSFSFGEPSHVNIVDNGLYSQLQQWFHGTSTPIT